jgi:hypothetical protein
MPLAFQIIFKDKKINAGRELTDREAAYFASPDAETASASFGYTHVTTWNRL